MSPGQLADRLFSTAGFLEKHQFDGFTLAQSPGTPECERLFKSRMGAGVVERARLESVCTS